MPTDIKTSSSTDEPPEQPKVKTVIRRSLARLLAVQAMYEMEMAGGNIDKIVKDYVNHRIYSPIKEDGNLDFSRVDKKYFEALMIGCYKIIPDIDMRVQNSLKNRTLSQIEAILLIILRLGIYEGLYMKKTKKLIVIDEYVDLTKSFFDRDEPAFVNAILDKVVLERTS